jgi:hypothetical protein
MTYSKILAREDGTQVKIEVELAFWRVSVYVFVNRCNGYWRDVYSITEASKLPKEQRKHYRRECILNFVTFEEIQQTKLELWESIKPDIGAI